MRADEFSKMRALQDTHWWFRGRRGLLRGLIRKLALSDALMLDAGCGTGFGGSELSRAGTVIGLDASVEAFAGTPVSGASASCVALAERMPFASDTFDLVVALDLLEHLDDDMAALREMRRVCKPGGYLFITVPACKWIWSRHDEVLGHRRRYSRAELAEKASGAGFAVCKSSYAMTALFPAAALYRLLRRAVPGRGSSDLFGVPKPVNALLGALMWLESRLVWRAGLPFGLTAILLARREQGEVCGRGAAR